MIRLIGSLFLGLTLLAGITVATLEIALINAVVFLVLALGVAKFLEPRFGQEGLVYGMAGAFFVSFLWPYAMIFASDGCSGDACLAEGGSITATLEPVNQ
ncbi:hypothetical protein [Erythrobacter crassostreae]|uniref:Uncharacterized protein n=1 Tax=Erythrobacter crassostreae TaxID=2828328 RepID=A0A9X1F0W2_9SPHN|nr:hypothetical protein [Erythrobacter crassostrea]MBV7258002.1 hypothetical protein [Erythrobacter crassostrea]